MKKIQTGEIFLIIDMTWIKKNGKEELLLECLGDEFIEGTDNIINQISNKENELSAHEIGYELKKKMGIFYGMCCVRLKVWIKRLLGRPF